MKTEAKHHQHHERTRKSTKPDQLIHRIYCKTVQLVIDARIEYNLKLSQPKLDKWFNLELHDPDYFKEELKTWKSISSLLFNHSLSNSTSSTSFPSKSPQPPNFDLIPVLILETILDIQQLPPDSFLTFVDNHGQEVSVDHRVPSSSFHHQPTTTATVRPQMQKNIVIERWSVSLVGPIPLQPSLELPTVYRNAIIHFRAFYSFLRTMPASSLFQRLKNRNEKEYDVLKIGCRLSLAVASDQSQPIPHKNLYPHEIGIHQPLSDSHPHLQDSITDFNFPSIQTPFGSMCTRVTYRNQVEFRIGDKERVLSSRFRNEDQLERPLGLMSQPTANHRPGLINFTKTVSSVPIYKNTNPPSHDIHRSDPDPLNHLSDFSPDHRRRTSYGSLSTRRASTHNPPNNNNLDPFLPGFQSTRASENSLTAELLAATESSPFVSPDALNNTHGPQIGNVPTCSSSALTAKLVAHRQSLPPVLSNALPLPSSFNRPNSSVSTPVTVNTRIGSTGASPRQLSILSSSPLSGPSSSIRISSAIRPPQSQRTGSTPSHLLPGTSPPMSSGSIGSSYPPISGPLSPLSDQTHTTDSSSRPTIPSQPMVRRYSSSRHSRSFGQGSSSGGGSLLTAESGSLGARRRTFSISKHSSSPFDEHSKKLIDEDRNKIDEFLQLINSQILPPHPTTTTGIDSSSHPQHALSSSNQKDYEKGAGKLKSSTAERPEGEGDQPVGLNSNDKRTTNVTIGEDEDAEEDNKLSRLMKEKLDLTLKKLAGSVFTSSRQEIPIRIPMSNNLMIKVNANQDEGVNNNKNSDISSGPSLIKESNSNHNRRDLQEHHGVISPSLIHTSSGLAMLQGLKEECEDELEPDETALLHDDDALSIGTPEDQLDSNEVGVDGIRFEL